MKASVRASRDRLPVTHAQSAAFDSVPEALAMLEGRSNIWRDMRLPRLAREVLYRGAALRNVLSPSAQRERQQRVPAVTERSRHLFRQLLLAGVGGFSAEDAVRYDPGGTKSLGELLRAYVGYYRRSEIWGRGPSLEPMFLRNKVLSHRLFTDAGIPTTRVRMILLESRWYDPSAEYAERSSEEALELLGSGAFIVKPTSLDCGEGVFAVALDATQGKACCRGRVIEAAQLLPQIQAESGGLPYLVEERIAAHSAFGASSSSGLPTLRVMTGVMRDGGIEPFGVILRVPPRGAVIDNWARGGLAASVSLRDGHVGPPVRKRLVHDEAHDDAKTHESDSHRLPKAIPHLSEALDLAVRAHALLPGLPTVGWDIAVTKNGCVLVEGNDAWDILLAQAAMGVGLWDTGFRRVFRSR